MHSATTNCGLIGRLNSSNAGPRLCLTKLAAGTPQTRAFCECVGVGAIRGALTLAVLCALLLIAAPPAQAQTETVLYNFTGGNDGGNPEPNLTADGKGNLYGATDFGGLYGYGTVFELSPNGHGGWNETGLYNFAANVDGRFPVSPLIFDRAGNLYGATYEGGTYDQGTVFELSPVGISWSETILHNFEETVDGALPVSGPVMDAAGNLYGTLYQGNTNSGVVYELSPSGGSWSSKVIYTSGDNVNYPGSAGLTLDAAGNIFGVANQATVFELSPNGKGGWNSTVIHAFPSAANAYGTFVLDHAGSLYGTTARLGSKGHGIVYRLSLGKKGNWIQTNLYSFQAGQDGSQPFAGIVFDSAGNIYGTTRSGGAHGDGTVFELVAPVGKGNYQEKVLWSFGSADGLDPTSSLILDSAGNLYGATLAGGTGGICVNGNGCGVVFEVTP